MMTWAWATLICPAARAEDTAGAPCRATASSSARFAAPGVIRVACVSHRAVPVAPTARADPRCSTSDTARNRSPSIWVHQVDSPVTNCSSSV